MASAKQAAANRLNALKSCGPKNTEKVRFNALRHGLRAKTLVLPDENQSEFDSLLQDLESEFQPQSPAEFIQVERMAVNYWKLARADRREAFFRLNEMPDRFVDQAFKFQQGYERAFDRAQQALERLQNNRWAVALEDSREVPSPASETVEESPQPEPLAQDRTRDEILRADSQSAQPRFEQCASAAGGLEPASETVEQIPQPPVEAADAAASSPDPGPRLLTPAPHTLDIRAQSAEIENREKVLSISGFLRPVDHQDYRENPIIPSQF